MNKGNYHWKLTNGILIDPSQLASQQSKQEGKPRWQFHNTSYGDSTQENQTMSTQSNHFTINTSANAKEIKYNYYDNNSYFDAIEGVEGFGQFHSHFQITPINNSAKSFSSSLYFNSSVTSKTQTTHHSHHSNHYAHNSTLTSLHSTTSQSISLNSATSSELPQLKAAERHHSLKTPQLHHNYHLSNCLQKNKQVMRNNRENCSANAMKKQTRSSRGLKRTAHSQMKVEQVIVIDDDDTDPHSVSKPSCELHKMDFTYLLNT